MIERSSRRGGRGGALLGLALVVVAAGCSSHEPRPSVAAAPPPPHVVTASNAPAKQVAEPASTVTGLHPGEVRMDPGPFVDRVAIDDLTFVGGTTPTVTGALRVPVEVSELLLLEVRVAYYDASGRLVGRGVQHDAPDEGNGDAPVEGPKAIRVTSSQPAPTAVAAVLAVTQLVNE